MPRRPWQLLKSMVELNLLKKRERAFYLINFERESINVEMAIKLIAHYHEKSKLYQQKRKAKKYQTERKNEKYMLITMSQYKNEGVFDSVAEYENYIQHNPGEYVLLNVMVGISAKVQTQIMELD
jgi:hypothetical protein